MTTRDAREVAALRAQRRLLAERYRADNVSFSSGRIGILMASLGGLVLAGTGLLTAFGLIQLAFVLVGALVGGGLIFVGWFLRWTSEAERQERARERVRVRELEGELPRFFAEFAQLAGGSVAIDEGLEATINFLERTGMFGVPSLLLARFFHTANRRHRFEGSLGGAPIAIVVVLGEPGAGTARPHTAMSRSALGPHLFVLVPGVHSMPSTLEGFDLVQDGSDLVAVCELGPLPDPHALAAWILACGQRTVSPVDEGPPPPSYGSAMEAVQVLMRATESDHPEEAIAAIDPQLFWKRQTVPTARAVRVWAEEWGLIGTPIFDLRPGPVGTFATECWVRIGKGAGQRLLTVQAFEQPAGCFRVCYLGEGERGGGWHDTSQETIP